MRRTPTKNWAKNMDRLFIKKDIQMDNKVVRRYSLSLFIREMLIKTTLRYNYTVIRMANIKKMDYNKVLERMWRNCNPHRLAAGEIESGTATLENSFLKS